VSRISKLLVAAGALFGIATGREAKPKRTVEPGAPDPGAELIVVLLLLSATACAVAFIVVYATSGRGCRSAWRWRSWRRR